MIPQPTTFRKVHEKGGTREDNSKVKSSGQECPLHTHGPTA
jgi:hypothetical protein